MLKEKPTWHVQLFTRLFFPEMDLTKCWFTLGTNIYGPVPIPPEIMEHEKVHIQQQRGSVLLGIILILFYTVSKRVRYALELPAYQTQLNYYRRRDWSTAEKYRVAVAKLMSGKQYNYMVPYSKVYADLKLIE